MNTWLQSQSTETQPIKLFWFVSVYTRYAGHCDITVINSKQMPTVSTQCLRHELVWHLSAECIEYVAGNKSNAVMSPQDWWNIVRYICDICH